MKGASNYSQRGQDGNDKAMKHFISHIYLAVEHIFHSSSPRLRNK